MKPRRARALLEQAELHRQREEWEKAVTLARQVAEESSLIEPVAFAILAEGYERLGRFADAEAALRNGLLRTASNPALTAQLGSLLARGDNLEEGLKLLEKVRARLGRDPGYLVHFGLALMKAGREDDAEAVLTNALTLGGGNDARLTMALLKGRRGHYREADALAALVEASETGELLKGARAVRADSRLFLGDAAGALSTWKQLEADGQLDQEQLGHMAYAAQLAGEPVLADRLMTQRLQSTPTAEDRLLFAQICLLRDQAVAALEHLDASAAAPGEHFPGHDYEVMAVRGRALRMSGRNAEAKQALEQAAELPEFATQRLGPRVHVDLGHLAAEEGDFLTAEKHFRAAQDLDADDPEAKQALVLTARKIAWKSSLEASAQARVEAANAETEAMKRRFVSREGELEAMRKELQRLKVEHRMVSEKAEQAQADAAAAAIRAFGEQRRQLRVELEAREQEADNKAEANLDRALEGVHCPHELIHSLRVAERTFQQALNAPVPAASVAILFSGALERGLFLLYVHRFNEWLTQTGRREAFLGGAIRERRGRRVEYFDHFVEAFDDDRAGRAPSLGEVGRVLEKLDEPYLEPFRRFLLETYGAPRPFYAELAQFVIWTKETLRDPVAHGRFVDLKYDELRKFRERLLFSFAGQGPGALAVMLRPRQ